MNKSKILAAVAAALTITAGSAFAAPVTMTSDQEQCKVVGKDGVGLIKAGMGACKTTKHSCQGQNVAGDPDTWIAVPKGQCAKINAGDMTGVNADVQSKIVAQQ